MNKYQVVLITNDRVDVTADGFSVDYGNIVFYNNGVPTEDDKYPESINIMAMAAGTWTLVIKEGK